MEEKKTVCAGAGALNNRSIRRLFPATAAGLRPGMDMRSR